MNLFWNGFLAGGLICSVLTISILGIIEIIRDRKRFRMMKGRIKG